MDFDRGRPFHALSRALELVEELAHFVSCLCLIVLTAVVTADVLLRVLFSTPLQFQFELTELYLMPAIASLSLAWVYRHNSHLVLAILSPSSFGRSWPVLNILTMLLGAAFFAALTWRSGLYALAAWKRDLIYLGVYDWVLWLAYAVVPAGAGLLLIRIVHDIIAKLSGRMSFAAETSGGNH